jgi:hypothetical protein
LIIIYHFSEEMMSCCYPLSEIKKKGVDFDVFKAMAACKGVEVSAYRYHEK